MKKLVLNIACLSFIIAFASICIAQNNSDSKLKKFSPFLGRYAYTIIDEDRNAKGILEVTKSCDNSCIELKLFSQAEDKVADVQWKITWNTQVKRYDVEYFRNPPAKEKDEIKYNFKFKGEDFILSKATFGDYGDSIMSFRWTVESETEVQIIHEYQDIESGKVKGKKQRGLIILAKRIV